MIGARSATSIRASGQRPHSKAVYMTAPRHVCRSTKKPLPRGGRPYMTAECVSRVREKSLQLLLQKPHQPRREETGKTVRLIDRIAAPVMRRALQDRGAHKEAGLLQRQHERVGVRLPIDQVVLGADAEMHRELVVGAHRMTDR